MIQFKDENTDFIPGESIAGTVQWNRTNQGDCDRIEIRLIWYTHGKGDRDYGIADSKAVSEVQQTDSISFEFVAPHRPYSFSGKIVSLQWAIEAITFPDLGAEQLQLTITPDRQKIVLQHSG